MDMIDFIKLSSPIPSYVSESYIDYLWDDWGKCNELITNNFNLFIYTVISEDNKFWLINGKSRINRLGYIFSEKYIEIEEGIEY